MFAVRPLLLVCIACLFSGCATLLPVPQPHGPVSSSTVDTDFLQIQKGMTHDQVVEIMGRECDRRVLGLLGDFRESWSAESGTCQIAFDWTGKVQTAWFALDESILHQFWEKSAAEIVPQARRDKPRVSRGSFDQ